MNRWTVNSHRILSLCKRHRTQSLITHSLNSYQNSETIKIIKENIKSSKRNINDERRKELHTLVSSMTAQRIPVFSIAALRLSRVSWWYSWEPWEKLKRATFMPARRSFSTIGIDLDAGPRVHTIFVFGFFSATTVSILDQRTSFLCRGLWLSFSNECKNGQDGVTCAAIRRMKNAVPLSFSL